MFIGRIGDLLARLGDHCWRCWRCGCRWRKRSCESGKGGEGFLSGDPDRRFIDPPSHTNSKKKIKGEGERGDKEGVLYVCVCVRGCGRVGVCVSEPTRSSFAPLIVVAVVVAAREKRDHDRFPRVSRGRGVPPSGRRSSYRLIGARGGPEDDNGFPSRALPTAHLEEREIDRLEIGEGSKKPIKRDARIRTNREKGEPPPGPFFPRTCAKWAGKLKMYKKKGQKRGRKDAPAAVSGAPRPRPHRFRGCCRCCYRH